jgi:DNA-binding LacI/PurR family transcriptional regulator
MVVTDVWSDDVRIPVIEDLGMPAVLAGRPPREDTKLPAVWVDNAAGVASAVDYLVALGHRRIVRVAGLPALDHTQVRIAAFREATRGHGLGEAAVIETDFSWEDGARATRELLSRRDRPTAITFDNDVMAVAALNVAQEMGVAVPEELSILAGDDSQLCVLVRPALSALAWDIQAYGVHTARVLLELIDGQSPDSLRLSPARLVVRASTGPPPG